MCMVAVIGVEGEVHGGSEMVWKVRCTVAAIGGEGDRLMACHMEGDVGSGSDRYGR